MADGSLNFDTKIDTDGFEKGASTLKSRMQSVVSSMKRTGNEMGGAFNGVSSNVLRVENSIKATENAMVKLSSEMNLLATKEIPTSEYIEIKNQLDGAVAKYDALIERKEKFLATGGSVNSKAFQGMEYDLQQLSGTIGVVKAELAELVDSGGGFTLGSDSSQYSDMQMKYLDLSEKADVYRQRLAELNSQQNKTTTSSKSMGKSLNNAGKSMKKNSKMAIPLAKSIFKLSNMFKLLLLRMAMRAVIQGVKEGFQNLAQYSKQANKDISALKTSMQTLKNSFATAFAPILTAVTPILQTLINYLSHAISVAGQFFAVFLNGASTFTKAKDAQVDYAKSLKNTAKQANKTLSPIDKLNVVGSDAGGGGSSGPSPADMFEDVKIDSKIVDAVNLVKEAITKLGEKMQEFYEEWGVKDIFEGIKEGASKIDFSKIKENFSTSLSGWGVISKTAFTNLKPIYKAGGELLGTALKYGIATAGNVFESFTTGFANFTTNMKQPIQTWIEETSLTITEGITNLDTTFEVIGGAWLESIVKYKPLIELEVEKTYTNIANTYMLIGTILADAFEIVTRNLKEFVVENEGDIKLFTDNLVGMFTDAWGLINDIWADTLTIIGDFWDEWGKDIVDSVMGIVKDIGAWFLYLWNDLVKPLWDEMLVWLKDLWDSTFKDVFETLSEVVGEIGILIKFLWDKVLQPIIDKLLKYLVPAFKNTFTTILSIISTTVKSVGKVIKGLLTALGGIITFLTGVFTGDWKKAWNGVKKIFKGIMDSLVAVVKAPINLIIDIINGMVGGIVLGVNSVIKAINSISFTIPEWVPGVGGKGIGFNLKEMKAPKIPKLATGTVVPANYGEFMAILGDNKRETEIVSPLSTMKQAMKEALAEVGGMGGGSYTFVAQLDGKTIFKETINQDKLHKKSTGQSAFAY